MLFAGWEVRMVKNCDRGLENAARGRSRGQHFQAQGRSFSLYGPTSKRQMTCLFFPAVNWLYRLQLGLFMQLLSFNGLGHRLPAICKKILATNE